MRQWNPVAVIISFFVILLLPYTAFADKFVKLTEEQLNWVNDTKSPILGDPAAPKTIVYFFDYRCPYCKAMNVVINQVAAKHKDIKIVFKEFPVIGKESFYVAQMALAAHNQNKYFKLHNALMEFNGALTRETVMTLAKAQDLDLEQLEKDSLDPHISEQLKDNYTHAKEIKVNGTPAFIIGDKMISGLLSYEEIVKYLEE